jgi:hypothetical protein
MESWYIGEERQVKEGERYIPMQYLRRTYRLLNTIIYRVYNEKTGSHVCMEWFPMANAVVKIG